MLYLGLFFAFIIGFIGSFGGTFAIFMMGYLTGFYFCIVMVRYRHKLEFTQMDNDILNLR